MRQSYLKLFFFLLATFVLAVDGTAQQRTKIDPKQIAALDSFINANMKEAGMVGIGFGILVDRKLVLAKGYGYADLENKVPFTPNTIINLASIGKTFTGVCMMRAVEDKKLVLDEDINNYLPFKVINPYFPNEKITLRNLAQHTSGITDRAPTYDSTYYYGGDSPVKLETFLRDYFIPGGKFYAKENFLDHKPGTYREYCNIAAALAGYIVELATGKPLNVYSREIIFNPLKMKNTGWFLSEIALKNHSKLYDKRTDTLKTIPLYGLTTYPDGGVRSSVTELSKFFIALLGDGEYAGTRILKKETVAEITRLQFTEANHPENVNPKKINSGLFWATKDGGTKIGHGGTDPGLKTEMLADLNKEVGVILFSNTELTDKNLLKYYFGIYKELFNFGNRLKMAETKR